MLEAKNAMCHLSSRACNGRAERLVVVPPLVGIFMSRNTQNMKTKAINSYFYCCFFFFNGDLITKNKNKHARIHIICDHRLLASPFLLFN
jgi:hypothetical protein